MKTFHAMAAASVLALLAGCGSKTTVATGPDGEKVTADANGNMTFTDNEGNRVDVKGENGTWTAESADGSKATMTEQGVSGQSASGEKYSMGMTTISESELGLPFYPGSTPIEHRDMKVDADDKHMVLSVRATKDKPDKVVEFYKSKVEKPTQTLTDQIATMGGTLADGGEVSLSAIINGTDTEISITITRK